MRGGVGRAVAAVLVVVVAAMPAAGCMTTTRFAPGEIPKLRPLMAGAGAAPARSSVLLRGDDDELVEVERDTELELVIRHRGRPMRGLVTPGQLSLRADGLLVQQHFVPVADVVAMELRRVSAGNTVGLVLGCVAGAAVTLFGLFLLVILSSSPDYG